MALASVHFTFTIPGGFHVPSPGGRMEGGSVFGQLSSSFQFFSCYFFVSLYLTSSILGAIPL
jgi:hypothetical protein